MVHLCEWLTLSQVSRGGIKQENKKLKKIKKSQKGERAIFLAQKMAVRRVSVRRRERERERIKVERETSL